MESTAFIFPAFGERLAEKDIMFHEKHKDVFHGYFEKISASDDCFAKSYGKLVSDELNAQYAAYAYSCAASSVLKQNGIVPTYLSGYSLGLYASLYHAGSITYDEGLALIGKIFNLIIKEIEGSDFGIAVIIGLEKKDVNKFISENSSTIEIINENNKYSFVIAGKGEEIQRVLELCIEEGGMNSRMLPIRAPYHSKFVAYAAEKFLDFVKTVVNVRSASIPLISTIDQRIVSSKTDIEKEIADNIKYNINWNKTIQELVSLGCSRMIECGIGKSLVKIGKFIEGDYRITGLDKVFIN